jgi:hypothetical protein
MKYFARCIQEMDRQINLDHHIYKSLLSLKQILIYLFLLNFTWKQR